jgi:hypothetical protein
MKNKIFLLGVGAQKSGTTWLYDYLKNHPNVNLGFAKEYHIFDALYTSNLAIKKKYLQERINQVLNSNQKPTNNEIALLKFLGDTNTYFKYFDHLVTKDPKTLLTGDITPSYSALSSETFEEIKHNLKKMGFMVKVVFLMRDPVERCISASRMSLRNNGSQTSEEAEISHIKQNYQSENYQIRARYDNTIQNIEAVFDANEIHYAFYEELFTENSIKEICDYLEIPFIPPNFNHNPNKSRTSNKIPDALKQEIVEFYKPVYDFVSARFGEKRIKKIWINHNLFKNDYPY